MNLTEYYSLTALPATAILLSGGAVLLATRRKSAQVRQFVCGATLASLLLIAVVPTLPQTAKPTLPAAITRSLPTPPRLELTLKMDEATEDFQTQTTIAPSRLDLLAVLALVGVAISTLLALRLAGSLLAVARLRKLARPASSRIRGLAEENVRVVESLSSPVALGGFKPVILLPAEAENWPEDRIRAVLIHEQAHLRNGDPNWQLLAEVACLLHWFNPLAWFVRGAMRREAERAADDAVLRAGIRPSDYASELVAFAAKMGADRQPVAWTAFARKSGVSGRVRAILTPHLERKPMTKKTRFTAIASVALAAYGVSAYAFQDRETSPQSSYKDVRDGKTIPASQKNKFVGEFADGRKVEIIQVSQRWDNGKIIAWTPDGTMLLPKEHLNYRYHHSLKVLDSHTRYVFARFPEPKGGAVDLNAAFGSGATDARGPSSLIFAGGGVISRKDGMVTVVGYIGVPKEDGKVLPLSFGVYDEPWTDEGVISKESSLLEDVSIREVAAPDREDGPAFDWAKKHPGKMTRVEFKLPVGDDLARDFKVEPVFKNPRQVRYQDEIHGNYGGYTSGSGGRVLSQRLYVPYSLSALKELRLLTRRSQHVEIHGMAIAPTRVPNP